MPHVHPYTVHPLGLPGTHAGMGAVPVIWALGSGLLAAGVALREKWPDIKAMFNPLEIKEPPPTVTPAAPQSYGALTIPGAWTPQDIIAHTQQQQKIAQQAYASGSRVGFDVGSRMAGGGDLLPDFDPDDDESRNYTAFFLVAVLVVGAVMMTGRR